jgi:SET domain-containing protein
MRITPPTKIYVTQSPVHGLGVFASDKISEGEVFEVCPILDIGMKRGESSPVLMDYRFNWPQGNEWDKQVVGLGYGSLYNHSANANANWRSNIEDNTFEFYATKEIQPGQEIFVWYGDDNYWNDGRVKLS